MPLVRAIVAWGRPTDPGRDWFSNTLYFNVSGGVGDQTDYQAIADDVWQAYNAGNNVSGCTLDVRTYSMDDAEPRPIKARKRANTVGTAIDGVPQVALCLSYYADRNLPSKRGRVYIGPFSTVARRPSSGQMSDTLSYATRFAAIGGLNVDWSLYSPKLGTNTRINHAWVDDSWDIIRSRKLRGTTRVNQDLNG